MLVSAKDSTIKKHTQQIKNIVVKLENINIEDCVIIIIVIIIINNNNNNNNHNENFASVLHHC